MYADLMFIDHDGHIAKDVELPQPISIKKTHFHHLHVSFNVDTRLLFRGGQFPVIKLGTTPLCTAL